MIRKQVLFTTLLLGAVLVAAAGCGNNNVTATATPQPASTTVSHLPAPPSDNGTMPTPPQGFTPDGRPAAPEIDWSAAAAKLGVTEEQLKEAVGDLAGGLPDLAAAAATLGVTEEVLREALGFPAGGAPAQGRPQNGASPEPEPQRTLY